MAARYTRLFRYAAPHWRSWILILVFTWVGTACALLQPWPMQVVVDHVLTNKTQGDVLQAIVAVLPGAGSREGLLSWMVAGGLLIFVATSAANAVMALGWTRVGRQMVQDLAADLFAHLQHRSLAFHTRTPAGDSLSRITGDSWSVHTVVDTLLFAPGHALFTLVAMVMVMASLDPWLTVLALAVSPFMAGSAWLFGRPIRVAARTKREIESRLEAHVQQTLTGMPVVQAFTREAVEERRFHDFANQAIRAERQTAFAGGVFGLGAGLVSTVGTGAVLWLAAQRVLDGALTLGGTLVFMSYLASLQAQLVILSNAYKTMQTAGASIDRVTEVLETPSETPERPDAQPMTAVRGHVQLERIGYGYDAARSVLHEVSLEAKPGERVAIVGTTGSGKSTLMAMVPRFADPHSGRVLIDGHDLRDVRLRDLRAQVAVVFQDPFLFPWTIAENIAFGRPDATRHDIEAAARTAQAHDFIAALPEGYDTVLGERGATLSGGERQRVSIARAVLKNAPILILDEPTSALDAETEASLLLALEGLMAGRTTFIVAHRLSTIRTADRIAVMQDGRIVEQGSHAELLAAGRAYAALCRRQFGHNAGLLQEAG